MRDSKLSHLIGSFSLIEQREVRRFLLSPFFNTRSDLLQLFDLYCAEPLAEKPQVWSALFPEQTFDDQKLRLLMSYLFKLLEQYLIIKTATSDPAQNLLHLAAGYRQRAMTHAFERTRTSLTQVLTSRPQRDAQYFERLYRLHWESYQTAAAQNPSEALPLRELAYAADVHYFSTRLRLICLAAAQQGVYRADYHSSEDEAILVRAGQEPWASVTAVAVYLHCWKMIQHPEEEFHFQRFKEILLCRSEEFDHEEIRGLYLLAINYCIKRVNEGHKIFFGEVLDLYKSGLEGGRLFENGLLSRFTYHNIVAAGLQLKDYEWVAHFIHEYKSSLERAYRESSFSFNLARLEYSRQNYPMVLQLLQGANYRDTLLNLAAKTLLMKTWYELGETEVLFAHIDAMRNYIRRKKVIGYHKTNYLNVLKYTDKLLKINRFDAAAVALLKAEIEAEEILTERTWLIEQLQILTART
ncbi:MAG TPA: hypothetical protein PLL53_01265 [Saprospiraceae bacterium]|nr:hypothetical protein [Saprospiraceae bacterium]